jgi:hypothetical protein
MTRIDPNQPIPIIEQPWIIKTTYLHEADVLTYLAGSDEEYLYRGQTNRYPGWGLGNDSGEIEVLDCIIPSDLHTLEYALVTQGRESVSMNPLFGDEAVTARVAAIQVALRQLDTAWLESLPDPPEPDFIRVLLSLGQHVGVPTAFLDLTSDPRVALWMACHEWMGPSRLASGTGVLYRFHREALEHVLNSTDLGPYRGIQDLRHVPAALSQRPGNQYGLTAYGLEHPSVLLALTDSSPAEVLAIEAIEFIRDGSTVLPDPGTIKVVPDPLGDEIRRIPVAFLGAWITAYRAICQQLGQQSSIDLRDSDSQRFLLGVSMP